MNGSSARGRRARERKAVTTVKSFARFLSDGRPLALPALCVSAFSAAGTTAPAAQVRVLGMAAVATQHQTQMWIMPTFGTTTTSYKVNKYIGSGPAKSALQDLKLAPASSDGSGRHGYGHQGSGRHARGIPPRGRPV